VGLLAYDPANLDALRLALGGALDDLGGISCDDTEATAAMSAVRSARRTLNEFCLPRVQDILNSDAMTSYHRAKVDGNDIRNALVFTMAASCGWTVSTDPFNDKTMTVTPEEARALGFRLQNGNLDKLTDHPEEIAFIASQLAVINADPQLSAEFSANFSRLDQLADTFAVKRIAVVDQLSWSGDDPAKSAEVASLDATFAELTRLYQSRPSTGHTGPYAAWIAGVEPMTAALLLRYAGLDATTLARVSNDLLVRWYDTDPYDEGREQPMWTDMEYERGPNAADILFQLMLATPGAPTVYVIDAAGNQPSMWLSATDHRLAQQVALQGTDPANIEAAAAGHVLKSLIEFAEDDRVVFASDINPVAPIDYATFLGELVAPWLLQFSPLNDDWAGLDRHDKARLLEAILEDDGALAAMMASRGAMVDGLFTSVQANGATTFTLNEHAELLGLLGQLIVNQKARNEEERMATWDLWWDVLTTPVAFLKVAPIVGVGIDRALDQTHDWIVDNEWLAAPSPDHVEHQAEYDLEWSLTLSGATMATVAFFQVGYPPEIKPPPRPNPNVADPQAQYEEDFNDWMETLPDDQRRATVEAWKSPFLNAAGAGESMVN
jgi:hypothetical protein